MDAGLIVIYIVGLIVLIMMSAFFSASETAYTSINKVRLKNMANDGNKKAKKALKLAEDYNKLLTTILIGNNLVNILAASICTILFEEFLGAMSVVISTIVMLIVTLTFGEITPKTIAKKNPEKVALMFYSPLSFFFKLFSPLSFIFGKISNSVTPEEDDESPSITEDELVVMIDEIEGEGTLEKTESDLIKSAIQFDDKCIADILTPRVDIIAVDKSTTMEEMRNVILTSGFSRIPIFDGSVDRIIGVVYTKDFYSKYFEGVPAKVTDIMRPVKFVPETSTVADTFAVIQKSMVQMVVVIDEYGGTVGIVSLEDLLEELVGEIWDESDEVQYPIVKESDGTYAVLGDTSLNDIIEETGRRFDTEDYENNTIGGYIQSKLNRVPVKGDKYEDDSYKIIVTNVRNRRVKLVQLTVKELPEPEEDEGFEKKLPLLSSLHSLSSQGEQPPSQ